MKIGGQILWNVTPICETSQIYCLMGRRPMKDVLGNHLKDLLFHSVHWFPQPHDSFLDAGEAINDFWSMSGSFIYRRTQSQTSLAERRIVPYSTEIH